MTSNLTFWKTGLIPANNMIVQDTWRFLDNSGQCVLTDSYDDFQYIRTEAEIDIKIARTQELIDNALNPDYLCIEQDDRRWFYYIYSIEQVSANTLKYHCVMDVLNTFQGNYSLSEHSMIERQHEDRFRKLGSVDNEDSTTVSYGVIRSRTDEQLTPKLYKTSDTKIELSSHSLDDKKWYLIYRTSDLALDSSGNPAVGAVPCIDLVPEGKGFYLKKSGTLPTIPGITRNWFTATFAQQYFTDNKTRISYVHGDDITVTVIWRDSNNRTQRKLLGTGGLAVMRYESYHPGARPSDGMRIDWIGLDGKAQQYGPVMEVGSYQEEYGLTGIEIVCQSGHQLFYSNTTSYDIEKINEFPYFWLVGEGTWLSGLDSVDRTDSRIVKIIECPYCPIVFTETSTGNWNYPTDWSLTNDSMLRTKKLDIEFKRENIYSSEIERYYRGQTTIYAENLVNTSIPDLYDPKVYNNATYRDAYVYDTNEYDLPIDGFEYLHEPGESYTPVRLNIDYYQSNSVASDLGFKFKPSNSDLRIVTQETFGDVLTSNRNNEVTVFTSDYLNYMKNGYNYDKEKLKMQTDKMAGDTAIKTVAGIASIIAGAALSATGAGGIIGAGAITGGIGLLGGAVKSGYDISMTNKSGEMDIQQKINEAAARAYGVSGTNDRSLFDWYSDNKLHHMIFEPDLNTQSLVEKYYKLYGYAKGNYCKPNTDNRYFYNYVRGDVELEGEDGQPFFKFKNLIVQKYKEGVYYIHNRQATRGY